MTIRLIKLKKEKNFEKIVTQHLSGKAQNNNFAKKLYDSLCNNVWFNKSTKDIYSCSWRYAGGFVAKLRNTSENYLDFYCSGNESKYYKEVHVALERLGYKNIKQPEIEFLQEHNFK